MTIRDITYYKQPYSFKVSISCQFIEFIVLQNEIFFFGKFFTTSFATEDLVAAVLRYDVFAYYQSHTENKFRHLKKYIDGTFRFG